MAAKTPDTATTEERRTGRTSTIRAASPAAGTPASDPNGLDSYSRCSYAFITENIDNSDTFDTGITGDQQIVRMAWEPYGAVPISVAMIESAGVVTFGTSAANANGYLHIWYTG